MRNDLIKEDGFGLGGCFDGSENWNHFLVFGGLDAS